MNMERDVVIEYAQRAMTLPIGELSEPFETQFGWHVMSVNAREDRPASPQDIKQVLRMRFDSWLTEYRQTFSIEIFDVWLDIAPREPRLRLDP